FVAREDKQRFVQKLTDLNKALYDVETQKRYLLLALQRSRPDYYEISKSADDVKEKVDRLRMTVREVGVAVRAEIKKGGIEAEQQLFNAVGTRKVWIEDFQTKLKRGEPVEVGPLIKQGNAAVTALALAQ